MSSTTRPHRTIQLTTTPPPHTTLLRRIQDSSPNSSQLIGFLTLAIVGGILLLLTGFTITAIVLGFIVFAPIIVLTSPFWLPIFVLVFVPLVGFLSLCGFGVAAVAVLSWVYRYSRGLHPPGSDRFDYARNRIATTAREVKDYAKEYGGYLHSKVKDAAPGA
ncbi:oleosin 1-like [Chenopodium quinoa]|uniref:oleosin 1-like n=1 Tax=Chenopodium quinoa TaxID=63459 RepID=UPI000B7931CF|nr:oleosin 1-like [Chenopodium quinoa]